MNTEKLKSILFNRKSAAPQAGNASAARQYLQGVFEMLKELESNKPAPMRMASKFTADIKTFSDAEAAWMARELKQFLSAPGTKIKIKLNFFRSWLPKNSANK